MFVLARIGRPTEYNHAEGEEEGGHRKGSGDSVLGYNGGS